MKQHKYFISGDWGTSNFRLRVVEVDSLKVITERKTEYGIKSLYQKFKEQSERSQFQFFSNYLTDQIASLPKAHQQHPLVLSGMASANIGMKELAYTTMPFGTDGEDLIMERFSCSNGAPGILVSGAKSETGMMRGEEMQAIGLAGELEKHGDGILLLPGTHSKHITYQQGQFTDFQTFMTGELFELLSRKSILENNLTPAPWEKARELPFLEGVELGFAGQCSSRLFSVRAQHLLHGSKKEDNYFFLSGLLIGDELSYLKNTSTHLFLAAPTALQDLYQRAFQRILPHQPLTLFDNKVIENALLRGHKKILALYE